MSAWQNTPHAAEALYRYVVIQICGYTDMWVYRYVGIQICGYTGMYLSVRYQHGDVDIGFDLF